VRVREEGRGRGGEKRYQQIVKRGMVVGFTYRGHQIFLLIYRWDVRPICLLADDLFADVVLYRAPYRLRENGITTYRNAIGVLLANALGFSLAFL
jgi:hypothetical protein